MWREETDNRKRTENYEKERKRKEQEEREHLLAEEITAKKLNLNEAGEQISSDISFAEEVLACVDSSTQTEEFDHLVAGVPLERPFCEDKFQNGSKKVNFYTGLSSLGTLKAVFLQLVRFVTQKA